MGKSSYRNSNSYRTRHRRDSPDFVGSDLANAVQAGAERPLDTTSPRGLFPRGDGARAGKLRQHFFWNWCLSHLEL
jgi:hypothetical protein